MIKCSIILATILTLGLAAPAFAQNKPDQAMKAAPTGQQPTSEADKQKAVGIGPGGPNTYGSAEKEKTAGMGVGTAPNSYGEQKQQ